MTLRDPERPAIRGSGREGEGREVRGDDGRRRHTAGPGKGGGADDGLADRMHVRSIYMRGRYLPLPI